MPKTVKPLTDTKIRNAKPKNKDYPLRDGGGLYILIKKSGKKIFRVLLLCGKKKHLHHRRVSSYNTKQSKEDKSGGKRAYQSRDKP